MWRKFNLTKCLFLDSRVGMQWSVHFPTNIMGWVWISGIGNNRSTTRATTNGQQEFLVRIFYFHYLYQSTKNNSINLITKEYRYVDARDSNPLLQDDRHRWIQWAMARLPSFLTIGVAWNRGFCFTASTMEASVTKWLDYFSIFGYFSTTIICPMAQIIGPKVQIIYPMAQIICHSKVQNYE